MPKMQSSHPQCWRKNSAPGCFTSLAKMKYHWAMPLRKTPEVSSTQAINNIKGLVKTFQSNCVAVKSTFICPDEASWVSNDAKPASSGVSLINHQSSSTQKSRI